MLREEGCCAVPFLVVLGSTAHSNRSENGARRGCRDMDMSNNAPRIPSTKSAVHCCHSYAHENHPSQPTREREREGCNIASNGVVRMCKGDPPPPPKRQQSNPAPAAQNGSTTERLVVVARLVALEVSAWRFCCCCCPVQVALPVPAHIGRKYNRSTVNTVERE